MTGKLVFIIIKGEVGQSLAEYCISSHDIKSNKRMSTKITKYKIETIKQTFQPNVKVNR